MNFNIDQFLKEAEQLEPQARIEYLTDLVKEQNEFLKHFQNVIEIYGFEEIFGLESTDD